MEFQLVACDVCGDILSTRGGNMVECDGCERHFCLDCCQADFSDQASDDGTWGECQFCTGNDATTEQLLEFFLKKNNMTIEQLRDMYFKEFKK